MALAREAGREEEVADMTLRLARLFEATDTAGGAAIAWRLSVSSLALFWRCPERWRRTTWSASASRKPGRWWSERRLAPLSLRTPPRGWQDKRSQ